MSRKVLYFSKPKQLAIQGLFSPGRLGVAIGAVCDGSMNHGGGVVSDMEVQGQCITIRKSTPDGQPHRNYGTVCPSGQPNASFNLIGDGVMWPLALTTGVVFADEPDQKPKPEQPPKQGK